MDAVADELFDEPECNADSTNDVSQNRLSSPGSREEVHGLSVKLVLFCIMYDIPFPMSQHAHMPSVPFPTSHASAYHAFQSNACVPLQ